MRIRVLRLLSVLAFVLVGSTALPGTAVAATQEFTDHILWGPSYGHSGWFFHQYRNQRGPAVIYSANGEYDFVVQANGDLSTSKAFTASTKPSCTYPQICWLAYWRAHTDTRGTYFYLLPDGEMQELNSALDILWSSKSHPGEQYNYALQLTNNGNLIEYYARGNPLSTTSGRKIAWQTNRAPGAVRACAARPIDPGTTSIHTLVADEVTIYVKVHNINVLPLLVTVYRWDGMSQYQRVAHVVEPFQTDTFEAIWDEGTQYPHTIEMRTETPADSVVAEATVYAHCWYNP
jgi:hypothetical protein